MLLRSLTKHVKDQNWFAVALDFFIVVIGILIAFQITNWSETRQDGARERQVIDRLYSDFAAISIENEEKIAFLETMTDGLSEMEQLIVGFPEGASEEVARNFFETSFSLPPISGQSDTYLQLVTSGDMSLVSNDELRAELVAYASLTRSYVHAGQARREWGRPYIVPLFRLAALMENKPFKEAFSEAGSQSDLIVAMSMYGATYQSQLGTFKEHQTSISHMVDLLSAQQSQR